jgi:pimeloyl-ACP methyl ester carboxylesterase
MGGRLALALAPADPGRVERLVLISAARRSPTTASAPPGGGRRALADRIEAIGGRGLRPRVGGPAAVRRPAPEWPPPATPTGSGAARDRLPRSCATSAPA